MHLRVHLKYTSRTLSTAKTPNHSFMHTFVPEWAATSIQGAAWPIESKLGFSVLQ